MFQQHAFQLLSFRLVFPLYVIEVFVDAKKYKPIFHLLIILFSCHKNTKLPPFRKMLHTKNVYFHLIDVVKKKEKWKRNQKIMLF